uniref:Uncharacterized protein n=1 Tax=Kalanchoe fedtschenkoi TaxID=63787 RepID=A0A7N0UAG2_KALFE
MDASGSSASVSALRPSTSSSKRLIFDLRYGWVYDEWKEPSKEALSGGRGMFCILPIAKGVFDMASQTIGIAASSTTKVLGRPELLSPEVLLASVGNQFQNFTASIFGASSEISRANGDETLVQSTSK